MANTAYQSSYTGAQIDAAIGAVANKQDTLVSGTNIKTINNQSLLGSGDISISGGNNYIAMTATWDANDEYLENFAFDDASAAYAIYNANGANTVLGIETGTMDGNTFVSDDFYYYAQVDQENAGAQQYFFFEFWDNTDKYKVTIRVYESTLSVNTYSHQNFSSGEANVIESISVNNVAQTVTNKNVNITVPTKVSDLTNDSGFTSNTGTITGITMNNASKGTSGVVDLGTVITEHQDISGKADKSTTTTAGTYTSVTVNASGIVTGGTNPTTLAGYGITDAASSSDLADYLPLAGGTMTGVINFVSTDAKIGITTSGNDNLDVGWDWDERAGAGLGLRKVGAASNSGGFVLWARNANNSYSLTGKIDGSLTWDGDVVASGKVCVGTGGSDSCLASDSATNIYLRNSSGAVLVCDGKVIRRSTASTMADVTLGSSSYPWGGIYSTTGNFTDNITLANNKYLCIKDGNGTAKNVLYCSTAGNVFFGYETSAAGKSTYIDGNTIYFRYGTSHGTAMTIDSSGNVSMSGGLSIGGNAVVAVYSGSSAPSSATGSNGDIYIQTAT